jgi:hypothetical protein
MDARLASLTLILRLAFGLMATLAGLDKFFNILADWPSYIAPAAAGLLPFSPAVFMAVVGVVEMAVGLTILFIRPAAGAHVAGAWLVLVAVNLLLAGHFDVAVRDVVLSIAAFTLATLLEREQGAESATRVTRQAGLFA